MSTCTTRNDGATVHRPTHLDKGGKYLGLACNCGLFYNKDRRPLEPWTVMRDGQQAHSREFLAILPVWKEASA